MIHWEKFERGVNSLLYNIENKKTFDLSTSSGKEEHEIYINQVIRTVNKIYNNGFYHDVEKPLRTYIYEAKVELMNLLIDKNKRDDVISKVNSEFEELVTRLDENSKRHHFNHADYMRRLATPYFEKLQPIYDFQKWFLKESNQIEFSNKTRFEKAPIEENKSPDPYLATLVIRRLVSQINESNIEQIHQKNFVDYLFRNSDKAEINGLTLDKLQRQIALIGNKGEKLDSISCDGKEGGFTITEQDYNEYALYWLNAKSNLRKAHNIRKAQKYKEFIQSRIKEKPSDNSTKEINTIELQNSPFTTQRELDIFIRLNNGFNHKAKSRWTYIYNFMKDEVKITTSQKDYFTFVSDYFENVAKRLQSTANDPQLMEILREIYSS